MKTTLSIEFSLGPDARVSDATVLLDRIAEALEDAWETDGFVMERLEPDLEGVWVDGVLVGGVADDPFSE